MSHYLPDTRVTVYPFTHRMDGDEVIIANSTQSSFLSIPTPAFDLLTDLATGCTVGQAQLAFAQKYGETPDMEDFLASLAREDFVTPHVTAHTAALAPDSATVPHGVGQRPRYHFERIPEHTARRLFSRPILLGCGILIALALLAVAREPSLLPPPTILVFKHNLTLMTLTMVTFTLGTIFLHEMAHLLAARAAGAPSRLNVSTRLWFLVAETDMTGVWLASRRQRYLAFLAGPLLDATSGAVLLLVLWSDRHWLPLPLRAVLLCQVFLFTYLVRLLWQCYLFVRTDFYYVIATFFNCKNLLGDTQHWLRNHLARLWPAIHRVDQSAIPAAELRAIRAYAVVWLVGHTLAFGTLFFISLPILWSYSLELSRLFFGGHGSAYALIDALTWSGIALTVQGGGLLLWFRNLYRAYRAHARSRRMVS